MSFQRFIVCGDSYSEGMTDEIIDGNYRGWADRVADVMAQANPDFTYVNLAIRGKLIRQVVEDQVPVALKYVTGRDTLVSFHAGANDALRPGFQADVVNELYKATVRAIADSGATVMLFTVLEKTGNKGKGSEIWEKRFSQFNTAVREVGAEVGAIVVDANQEAFFSDRRFLAFDRLHLNAEGHKRCANAVLEKLGLPFDPAWRTPLPPAKKTPWIIEKGVTVAWFFVFALPWILRRIQGKSSGDGRSAKYPTPVKWPLR
ncbi:SGNH/GDSL hydrolase family protein [Actinobacteria bacterium IMCC25003]|nr:SGNH/GDSL hydrolase family protein [Actinobacteria bacterium IMCC25003]